MSAITYLSQPLPVHMADAWFEIASPGHFWIRRRFEVFRALWGQRSLAGAKVAEVGCGHGLVLQQFEEFLDLPGDGFDLNEGALKQAQATLRRGRLFCYDIHDRHESLREQYDLAVLFDVIEHIEDDTAFLRSARFLLKPEGRLVVNVPAHQSLYSWYDKVVGHQRRYDIDLLRKHLEGSGLKVEAWTYWGLPYLPLLWVRQRLAGGKAGAEMSDVKRGFAPPGRLANRLLHAAGQLETIPQHATGTSLMAVLTPA